MSEDPFIVISLQTDARQSYGWLLLAEFRAFARVVTGEWSTEIVDQEGRSLAMFRRDAQGIVETVYTRLGRRMAAGRPDALMV